MNPAAAVPDKADVQRLAVYGYTQNCSRHFVLRVVHAENARRFLATLLSDNLITSALLDEDGVRSLAADAKCAANIGFTYRGLQALELDEHYLRVFQEKSPAFAEGAFRRAARRLADAGANAAKWWDDCFQPEHAHVLLSLHADDERELEAFSSKLQEFPASAGLDGWDMKPRLEGCHLTKEPKNRKVHFGFRDGIADPDIDGFHEEKTWRDGAKKKLHAPGEFLLGYRNDEGFNSWLLFNPSWRPNPWLLPWNTAPELAEFFRNGSFAAFRKMEQDELAFNGCVARWAERCGTPIDYIRAKLGGRWEDGSVLKPDGVQPPADLDNFDFSDDPDAAGCPFGSHIRRMNPRKDPVVPFRRRPLIRRGMPYGAAYEKGEPRGRQRGLLGLFFCASLEDQFEHLLIEWGNANPMGPRNRGAAKDPLVGNHERPGAVFDIPMAGEKLRQLDGFRLFVTTRGTLYAFFPGLTALGRIASRGAP